MQIVPSTLIVMVMMIVMAARGPYSGLLVLFGLTPFGMMAAFNLPAVGGTSITGIDLAVLMLSGMILLRAKAPQELARLAAPGGAGILLLAFLGYATLVTLFMPRIFAGMTEVFGIGRSGNALGIVIRPLGPSGGNISQLIRMILSIMAFAAVAFFAARRPDPQLFLRCIQVATAVHVTLGITDILTNAANLEFLLAPLRTANYALTLGQKMAGLNRMIGGFPEASSFGYYSLGLLGFWLSYWFESDRKSMMPGLFLAAAAFVTLRSTSSSAYVGAALLAAVFVASRLQMQQDNGLRPRSVAILVSTLALIPVLVASVVILYQMVPGFSDFIDRSLINKLDSDSGEERMEWNLQALRNFYDTYMVGAGLGAVRASNWLISALATTGIPGTLLLIGFLWRVFRLPVLQLDPETRHLVTALKFGCAGLLCRALVVKASPNLDIFFFAIAGAAVGIVTASWARGRRPLAVIPKHAVAA
ncbi:hypothetical protein Ga0080574_TMP2549 [Salipiger abyssi]|uniref:O-antigen ligase like membrane protein n=1 Tax=Salipiger abyssi TaxID=1250539 RepID=A0A1P8UU05_9RHOB|nr:hypothetical protein Ga0080574_TMP2549 [Salipiger abyssi]